MWDSDDTGEKKSVHKEGHNHAFDNSDSSEWGYSDESPENNRQSNISNHNNGEDSSSDSSEYAYDDIHVAADQHTDKTHTNYMKYDVYASSEFDFSSSESGEIRNTDKTSSNGEKTHKNGKSTIRKSSNNDDSSSWSSGSWEESINKHRDKLKNGRHDKTNGLYHGSSDSQENGFKGDRKHNLISDKTKKSKSPYFRSSDSDSWEFDDSSESWEYRLLDNKHNKIGEKTKNSGRSYYRSSDSNSWEYGNDVDSKHTKLDEKADKSGRPYFRGSDSDSWEYESDYDAKHKDATNKIHHDRSGSLHQSSKSDKSLNGHSRKGHSSGDGTHGYTNSLESDSSDHYGGYENDDVIMSGLFKIEHSEMEYLGETGKHEDKTHTTKIQNGKKH